MQHRLFIGPVRDLRLQLSGLFVVVQNMDFGSTKLLRILIVEDDYANATLLRVLLGKSSLSISEIEFAESLAGAFELLDEKPFDVLLLDLNLPDSEGLDTLARITKRYPHVPKVAITGNHDEGFGMKVISKGAQEYLVKGGYDKFALTKSIHYAIERKRTHELIDRKQKNLEAIFDAAPVGMLLIDENMIINRVNDTMRRMVHKEFADIIGRLLGVAIACVNSTNDIRGCGKSKVCNACLLRKVIETVFDSEQPVRGVEMKPTFKVNGHQILPWLSVSAEPVIIDGRKHVIVALNDINDLKRAQDELKEHDKLKSEFIVTVSHEMRTPLTIFKNIISNALAGVMGKITPKLRENLQMANNTIDRLARIINDFLDIAKIEAGKMKLYPAEFDIRLAVSEVIKNLDILAGEKEITLKTCMADHELLVNADYDSIVRVLLNLINNAIKFIPEGGHITVRVKPNDSTLTVEVEDDGPGIPGSDLEKIFKRFVQLTKQVGPGEHGTGLGLSIAKELIEMNGGQIDVESELGQGTKFTVVLPLAHQSHMPDDSPSDNTQQNDALQETEHSQLNTASAK